jgi:hypothetical protein
VLGARRINSQLNHVLVTWIVITVDTLT